MTALARPGTGARRRRLDAYGKQLSDTGDRPVAAGGRCPGDQAPTGSSALLGDLAEVAETKIVQFSERPRQQRSHAISLSGTGPPSYMDHRNQFRWTRVLVLELVRLGVFGTTHRAEPCHGFGPAARVELGEHAVHVVLDGMNRDA